MNRITFSKAEAKRAKGQGKKAQKNEAVFGFRTLNFYADGLLKIDPAIRHLVRGFSAAEMRLLAGELTRREKLMRITARVKQASRAGWTGGNAKRN